MTAEQAGTLVATMQAAWPGFAAEDLANEMWVKVIARQPPEMGAHACRSLIGRLKHKPTIADWNEAVRAAERDVAPTAHEQLEAVTPANREAATSSAARIKAEYRLAVAERDRRRASMTGDEFIEAEGHDPRTHRLTRSGLILRRIDPTTRQPLR